MEITVFTPTYNRADYILPLYESLTKQTYKDFEWIVVDDGSTDNTEMLFSDILSRNNNFPIKYVKTENGGKHRAINKGIQLAQGKLFFIVDSDDTLPCYSLEKIVGYEQTIPDTIKNEFAGVAGLKGADSTLPIGETFVGEYLDITYNEAPQYGICGDKSEVYYTEVMKKYPFPEFDGEKFIMESVVWNKIGGDDLKLRYFNEVVYFCEYLEGGLTSQGKKKFESTPKGYGLFISQLIEYGKLKKLKKWNTVLEYYYLFNGKIPFSEIAENLKMNPVILFFRINGMRLFYKLYNR